MDRMSRAGRMTYTQARMRSSMKGRERAAFSKGDIARLTGVRSSTWFRQLLIEMVDRELLVRTTWFDYEKGYEMEAFYVALWHQPNLELFGDIMINGKRYDRMTGEAL